MKDPDLKSINKELDKANSTLDKIKNQLQILLDNDKLFKKKHYHRYKKGKHNKWICSCRKIVSSV